jgi:predicted GNAT superfamily acetyltransferase
MCAARFVVRDLRREERDEALRINNDNVPAVSHLAPHELESDLARARHALAIGDAHLEAFCVTFPSGVREDLGVNYAWFSARYDEFVYLDRVVVDAPYRSGGRGAALCEVNLRPRNDGSLRFHERLGFTRVGEQESKPGLVVAMLAKTLD